MQTRALRTLVEIARVGSFATAAGNLNMTLSAVSMQMKALETELDAALFDRTFRPPKLTSVGRTVCDHARNVLLAESVLVESCLPSDKLTGTFRIGFVATASVRLLPGFLNQARDNAPDAQFDIETGLSEALEARVLGGQLDAAVVTASQSIDPGLSYQTLREERLVYVAPNDFADLGPSQLFGQLPFFQFNPQSGIGKDIAAHVRSLVRRPKKSIVLDSVEAIMECVNSGIGFTLLPEPDVQRYADDQARILETGPTGVSRKLVLATSRRGEIQSRAAELERLFTD